MLTQEEKEFYADGHRVYKKIGKTILYTNRNVFYNFELFLVA
ncbi:Uncharacterised protein [Turicibacter sanguinis]|nr:Uncharacterised protein [Turicibacter sanguinis]